MAIPKALLWSEALLSPDMDKIFGEVCAYGGNPELGTEAAGWIPLNKRALGGEEQNAVRPLLAAVFKSRTLAEWIEMVLSDQKGHLLAGDANTCKREYLCDRPSRKCGPG